MKRVYIRLTGGDEAPRLCCHDVHVTQRPLLLSLLQDELGHLRGLATASLAGHNDHLQQNGLVKATI